jgi:NAD(P)-dependent dehydrogenase (short-subunit alcohol dehydrogenase family)
LVAEELTNIMTCNLFDLSGKCAVVIGGTSGFGCALSLGMADAGADVVPSARRKEQADDTAAEIERRGRQTLRLTSDARDRGSLQQLLAASIDGFGKVDILINCAGKTKRSATLTVPEEEWTDIIDTNLTGTLRACQIFGKHMLERGYGPHHQHRLSQQLRGASGSCRLLRQQSGCSLPDPLARCRMVQEGRYRQRHRSRRFSDRVERRTSQQHARSQEFLMRTPMGRFGKTEELVGAAIYLSSDAASSPAASISSHRQRCSPARTVRHNEYKGLSTNPASSSASPESRSNLYLQSCPLAAAGPAGAAQFLHQRVSLR